MVSCWSYVIDQYGEERALFVGDLSPLVDAALLLTYFELYGKVRLIEIRNNRRDPENPLLNAAVVYDKKDDAARALKEMNGAEILGNPIRVCWLKANPKERYIEGTNVIIRNLNKKTTQQELSRALAPLNMQSCKIARDRNGNSLGFAYASFNTKESADRFIELKNGQKLFSKKVSVVRHKQKSERPTPEEPGGFVNCYVKNLSPTTNLGMLNALFMRFGKIKSSVLSEPHSRYATRYALVCYYNSSDAQKAVAEMNGASIGGRYLYVAPAMRKFERMSLNKEIQMSTEADLRTIYIHPVTQEMTEENIKEQFSIFGVVEKVIIAKSTNGALKGYAFVQYSKPSEAYRAKEEGFKNPVQGVYMNCDLKRLNGTILDDNNESYQRQLLEINQRQQLQQQRQQHQQQENQVLSPSVNQYRFPYQFALAPVMMNPMPPLIPLN